MTSHAEIGNFIIPPDELIFFRGVGIPPTSFCGATVRMRGYNAIISASGRGGQWQMACHLLGELLGQTSTASWSFEKQLPQDRNIWTPRGLLYAFISYIWEAYRFEFIIPYWSRPDISNMAISWPMRMSCEGVQPDVISFWERSGSVWDWAKYRLYPQNGYFLIRKLWENDVISQ